MLNITAELNEGRTGYSFSARGMDYTIYIDGDDLEIWTYNNTLNRRSLPKVVNKGSKLPKAIKAAVDLIEAPSLAA